MLGFWNSDIIMIKILLNSFYGIMWNKLFGKILNITVLTE